MDPGILIQTILSGASAGGVYALVAIGFGLLYRTTKVFNFAQGDFSALGAYICFVGATGVGLPLPVAIVVALFLTGLLAVVFERFALRPLYARGEVYTFISTIGLAFVIQSGIQQIWGPVPVSVPSVLGDQAVKIAGFRFVPQVVWTLAIALTLAAGLFVALTRSLTGTAMRGAAQDRYVVSLLGIMVDRVYGMAFFISGALGAAAGILIAPIGSLSPTMGVAIGVPGFIAALIGGLGSMPGAVVGGLLLGIVQGLASLFFDPRYRDLIVYAAVVIAILVRPGGLVGEGRRVREV